MVSILLDGEQTVAVQCAGHTYSLSLGENDSLYIAEEGQYPLSVTVEDEDEKITIQGQWLTVLKQKEERKK